MTQALWVGWAFTVGFWMGAFACGAEEHGPRWLYLLCVMIGLAETAAWLLACIGRALGIW